MRLFLFSLLFWTALSSFALAVDPSEQSDEEDINLNKIIVGAVSLVIGGGVVALLQSGAKSQIEDSIESELKPYIVELEKVKIQLTTLQTRQEIQETRFSSGLTNLGDRMEHKIEPILKQSLIHDEMLNRLTDTLSELKIDVKVLVSSARKMGIDKHEDN